jgi:uncharacterized protein YuzE
MKADSKRERRMIRATYSPQVDALGIRLARGIGHVGTKELKPDIYVDFDEAGRLVGIEVLNASAFYDQAELEQLTRPGAENGETP